MAYITRYNADRIVRGVDLDKVADEELYPMNFYMFTKKEKKQLLAYKSFMQKSQDEVSVYEKLEKRKDSFNYIKESDNPSYHLDKNCPKLNSNFCVYLVPLKIQQQGKDAVKAFRKWFKEHSSLLTTDEVSFNKQLYSTFGVSKLEIEERDNSGIFEIDNLSQYEIEFQIEDLVKAASKFYNNPDNKPILKVFLYRLNLCRPDSEIPKNDLGKTDDEIRSVLSTYLNDYKMPIARLLKEYYRVKFNPDLRYDVKLLEQLGFRPCSECCKQRVGDLLKK